MIDPTTRSIEIEKLAAMPDVGVLLLDVVLGYGACADPAGAVVEAIERVRATRSAPLVTIATMTGTDADPQGRSGQIDILRDAGIAVVETPGGGGAACYQPDTSSGRPSFRRT